MKKILISVSLLVLLFTSAFAQNIASTGDLALNRELASKDSLFFDIALNSCKVERLPDLFTASFVFLHDQGLHKETFAQSGEDFFKRIAATCGKVKMRREVADMQSFRLNDVTAIQTGLQRFYVDNKPVEESKFTRHWRKEQGIWKMADETDYLVNNQPGVEAGKRYLPGAYVPASAELYNTIVKMDSIYFDTYNRCNIVKMDSLTADDIEFYHDRGGFSHSKKELLASIQKNICGKVTRILTPGSIEVYEIPGYGAVQFGYHSFRNVNETGESHPSKFVTLWRLKDSRWQITRVFSLH
ncbi:nuclear transport factor 2 family protein [Pedobacter panaciterrae]